MDAFDHIAENRIREAAKEGLFDNLPGKGKPLQLDDEPEGVPKELSAAFRILKNAGVLPEELELQQRHLTLGELLRACESDDPERAALEREYRSVSLRYHMLRERRGVSSAASEYSSQVLRKLTGG